MNGEITWNGQIETNGVVMYCGIGGMAPEIQIAFAWAVGVPPSQIGPGG